jgi:hypothetical protein
MSKFLIFIAVLGILLTGFGMLVTFEFVDTLSTITDAPLEYWGFPLTALATIVAFWLLVTGRNRQSLGVRLGLIALLLSFPVFESIANVFFFDDVEPIRMIPFVGPIVSAFDLLSMPEFIDLYTVAFAAFPILILISIVVFLIPSSKKASPERICPSCSFPAQPTDSFCGNCGAELESKTASPEEGTP